MFLFGEEKITEVSTALLYIGLEEIEMELERRHNVQRTEKLNALSDAIKAAIEVDENTRVSFGDGEEIYLAEMATLISGKVRVSLF